MKAGDLVKSWYGDKYECLGGIVLAVCYDLGVPTIDVLFHDGRIAYDQRVDQFEVVNEGG